MKRLSRFPALLPNNFSLLVTAHREATLAGRTSVTLDDLLVALLVSGGSAARVLSTHGVELGALRAATSERDAADLASLGLPMPAFETRRLSLSEAMESQRTIEIESAVEELLGKLPSEEELLHALIDHPSGGPAEALRRAGVDVTALRRAPWPRRAESPKAQQVPGLLDGLTVATTSVDRFVPIAFDLVVPTISDPELAVQWLLAGLDTTVEDGVIGARVTHGQHTADFEMRRMAAEHDAAHCEVVWQQFWLQPVQDDPRGYYLQVIARPVGTGTELSLVRGIAGRGRFAAPARWISTLFAKGSARSLVQGIVEVALSQR